MKLGLRGFNFGQKMKNIAKLAALVLAAVVLWYALYCLPGGDGIVSQLKLSDGTQVLVAQVYNGTPYKVGFYFKEFEEEWGWCYLGHEETRWRRARIEYDPGTDEVRIWKGKVLRGIWNRRTSMYYRPDVPGWETVAPQEFCDPPFAMAENKRKK